MAAINFSSEEQLEEAKRTRGESVDDGTAPIGRPLHEILNENKAKKRAKLEERRKHKPPKALDEDEVQFLDEWDMYKREKDRRLAAEEDQELRHYRSAVAARCVPPKEIVSVGSSSSSSAPAKRQQQQQREIGKKNNPTCRPLNSIFKVVPMAKKPKKDHHHHHPENVAQSSNVVKKTVDIAEKEESEEPVMKASDIGVNGVTSLVSDSEDDD